MGDWPLNRAKTITAILVIFINGAICLIICPLIDLTVPLEVYKSLYGLMIGVFALLVLSIFIIISKVINEKIGLIILGVSLGLIAFGICMGLILSLAPILD